jgi:hypothetical protein
MSKRISSDDPGMSNAVEGIVSKHQILTTLIFVFHWPGKNLEATLYTCTQVLLIGLVHCFIIFW